MIFKPKLYVLTKGYPPVLVVNDSGSISLSGEKVNRLYPVKDIPSDSAPIALKKGLFAKVYPKVKVFNLRYFASRSHKVDVSEFQDSDVSDARGSVAFS